VPEKFRDITKDNRSMISRLFPIFLAETAV